MRVRLLCAVVLLSFSSLPAMRQDSQAACTWIGALPLNATTQVNKLTAVSATSSTDVWAAGYYQSGSLDRTLVEHWNGVRWNFSPTVNVSGVHSLFQGVYARAPNDVWAVGVSTPSSVHTLIEHYNGTSWSVVPSPNVGTSSTFLYSVASIAANDAWAVGVALVGNAYRPISMHWNGQSWRLVSMPAKTTTTNFIVRLVARSSNDVWSVGYYTVSGVKQTLIEHWNGAAWSIISSPNVPRMSNALIAVSADAANDAWAVGFAQSATFNTAMVLRWNGSSWVAVSPQPSVNGVFHTVVALSPTSVWAIGFTMDSVNHTLAAHWNGSAWSTTPTPNVGTGDNYLIGATRVPLIEQIWAVGEEMQGPTGRTLAETHC